MVWKNLFNFVLERSVLAGNGQNGPNVPLSKRTEIMKLLKVQVYIYIYVYIYMIILCIVLYNCLCYIMVYINYIIQGKCVSFLRPGTWPPLHNCWTLWLDHGRTEVNKHASVAFQPLQNSQDIGSTWGLKLIEND